MEYREIAGELGRTRARVAGLKQVLRALEGGSARVVVLAQDADGPIRARVRGRCEALGVPCVEGPAMRELGPACRLDVPTAVACLIHNP